MHLTATVNICSKNGLFDVIFIHFMDLIKAVTALLNTRFSSDNPSDFIYLFIFLFIYCTLL